MMRKRRPRQTRSLHPPQSPMSRRRIIAILPLLFSEGAVVIQPALAVGVSVGAISRGERRSEVKALAFERRE